MEFLVAVFGLLSFAFLLTGAIMVLFRRFRWRGAMVCVGSLVTLIVCLSLTPDNRAAVEAGFESASDQRAAAHAGFETAALWSDYKAAKAITGESEAAEVARLESQREAAEERETATREAEELHAAEQDAARTNIEQPVQTSQEESRLPGHFGQSDETKTSGGSWLVAIGWSLFAFAILGGIGALFNSEVRVEVLQGAGVMFGIGIILITIGSIGAEAEAPSGTDCGIDPHCLGDKKRSEIRAACSPLIERHAKVDYEWTSGMFSPRFPINRWQNADYTTLVAKGDALKFQNGFGAWMPVNYACAYNIRTNRVEWVEVLEGRLR